MGIRRVFEILDMDPEVKDQGGGLASVIRGKVEFRNVCAPANSRYHICPL